MSTWEIIITPEASKDIRDIYDYISGTLMVSSTAKSIIKGLLATIRSLSSMPMRCPLYEKEPWRARGLRKIGSGNFLVFYLPNEATHEVVIFHVFYGGRNIEKMLEEHDGEAELRR